MSVAIFSSVSIGPWPYRMRLAHECHVHGHVERTVVVFVRIRAQKKAEQWFSCWDGCFAEVGNAQA